MLLHDLKPWLHSHYLPAGGAIVLNRKTIQSQLVWFFLLLALTE